MSVTALLAIFAVRFGPVAPPKVEAIEQGDEPDINDEASSGPTQRPEWLNHVLAAHKEWLESSGKRGKRADLAKANLRGVDLRSAELSKANLREAFVAETDFSGADLSFADLSHVRAPIHSEEAEEYDRAANFSAANLTGANLAEAELIAIDADNADFTNANLRAAQMNSSSFVGANFDNADLTDVSAGPYFSPATGDDWNGTNFSGASFRETRLLNAFLAGADLSSTSLESTDLTGTRLYGVDFADADFEVARLPSGREFAVTRNLQKIRFEHSPSAFFQLAEELKKNGLREQEREVTYALRRERARDLGSRCQSFEFDGVNCASYVFQTVAFDFPASYGLRPLRPVIVALLLVPFFAVIYYILFALERSAMVAIILKSPRF